MGKVFYAANQRKKTSPFFSNFVPKFSFEVCKGSPHLYLITLGLVSVEDQLVFILTCTRSGLLQERFVPVGGGGGGGQSPLGGPSVLGPYSSSSTSVLLHLDIEELQETDLNITISLV